MAVEINIDLDSSKADTKIEQLRGHLKSLNDDLDLDFDIDDDLKDKIDKITSELKDIEVNVDYDDLEKAAALKAMLQGDIDADLNVDTDKALADIQESLDPGGGGGIDHGEQARKFSSQNTEGARFERFMERLKQIGTQPRGADGTFGQKDFARNFLERQRNGGFSGVSVDLGEVRADIQEATQNAGGLKDRLDQRGFGKIGDPMGVGDYDSDRLDRIKRTMSDRGGRFVFGDGGRLPNVPSDPDMPDLGGGKSNFMGNQIGGFKKKLKGLIPSMSTFYSMFAAVIPLMISMGTQLMGVAAAMGSVAVAGGSILALGLVGHGEDMASSWQKAQDQLGDLKKELFETFQPTMQTFAPIQARFFDAVPGELNKVASSMEGLTAYSDTLFKALSGVSDFIADFFNVIVANEGIMSQLAMRFGSIIGTGILDFFQFIVTEAYNSQEMLITLGSAFVDLLSAAYQFSKMIARVVSVFTPLAGLLSWVAQLLNNKVVVGVLAFVATLGMTVYAVTTLVGVMSMLVSVWSAGLIATIISSTKRLAGYIFQTIAASVANNALAASIANVVAFATLGIGALLGMAAAAQAVNSIDAGVDMSGPGGAGGGLPTGGVGGYGGGGAGSGTTQTIINQGDTYNMEVNGDVDNPTEQGLRDIVVSEDNVSSSRGYPSPGGS